MKLISQNTDQEIGDINVTPFVDVLLILLIIFMITAPVINKDIQISLPKENFQKTASRFLFKHHSSIYGLLE